MNITSIINRWMTNRNRIISNREDEVVAWLRDKFTLSSNSDMEAVFDGPVTCLALEDIEQRYLLSGTHNGSIYIHDLYNMTGNHQHMAPVIARLDRETHPGHKSTVAEVSWYPLDTGLFISSGSDRRLHVWDTNTMVKSESFKFEQKLICHAMSPVATAHSLIAACGETNIVTLCDLRSGSNTHVLRGHAAASVDTCRWSPAHQHLLATGGRDKRILFWDVRYAKNQLASLGRSHVRQDGAHRAPVAGLRFLSDGRRLVSVGRDGAAAVWDLLTGRPRWLQVPPLRLDNASGLGCHLAVTCGGRRQMALLPCGHEAVVVDLEAAAPRQRLDGHLRRVRACEYDRRCHRLLTAGADSAVLVWDAARQRPEQAAERSAGQSDAKTTGNGSGTTEAMYRDEWSDED